MQIEEAIKTRDSNDLTLMNVRRRSKFGMLRNIRQTNLKHIIYHDTRVYVFSRCLYANDPHLEGAFLFTAK